MINDEVFTNVKIFFYIDCVDINIKFSFLDHLKINFLMVYYIFISI